MSCKCIDKKKCRNDIDRIKDIASILFKDISKNMMVTGELSSLGNKERSTFTASNMDELVSEEKKLNDDMTQLLPQLLKKCNEKIESLELEYTYLVSEDSEYHRKQHN